MEAIVARGEARLPVVDVFWLIDLLREFTRLLGSSSELGLNAFRSGDRRRCLKRCWFLARTFRVLNNPAAIHQFDTRLGFSTVSEVGTD